MVALERGLWRFGCGAQRHIWSCETRIDNQTRRTTMLKAHRVWACLVRKLDAIGRARNIEGDGLVFFLFIIAYTASIDAHKTHEGMNSLQTIRGKCRWSMSVYSSNSTHISRDQRLAYDIETLRSQFSSFPPPCVFDQSLFPKEIKTPSFDRNTKRVLWHPPAPRNVSGPFLPFSCHVRKR